MEVSEEELESLYTWVDEIPLSRPKRNIARDFSDGVLLAEVVRHFHPKLVEIHNYSGANGFTQKTYNWNTLNQKVFKKLGFIIAKSEIEAVCNCEMGAVERVLKLVRFKLEAYNSRKRGDSAGPNADASMTSEGRGSPGASLGGGPANGNADDLQASSQGRSPLRPTTTEPHAGARAAVPPAPEPVPAAPQPVQAAVVEEYEKQLGEGREIIATLERKIQRLEELVRLKDKKIETMRVKLESANLA